MGGRGGTHSPMVGIRAATTLAASLLGLRASKLFPLHYIPGVSGRSVNSTHDIASRVVNIPGWMPTTSSLLGNVNNLIITFFFYLCMEKAQGEAGWM